MGQVGPLVILLISIVLLIRDTHCHPSNDKVARMPVMAQKSGGRYRSNLEVTTAPITTSTASPVINGVSVSEENNQDYHYNDYQLSEESSEEILCPPGKYLFKKGGKCVKKWCYWGNDSRNMVTGECQHEPKEGDLPRRVGTLYGRYEPRRGRLDYGKMGFGII